MDNEDNFCIICFVEIGAEIKHKLIPCNEIFCKECLLSYIEVSEQFCCPCHQRPIDAVQYTDLRLSSIVTKDFHDFVIVISTDWQIEVRKDVISGIVKGFSDFYDNKMYYFNIYEKTIKVLDSINRGEYANISAIMKDIKLEDGRENFPDTFLIDSERLRNYCLFYYNYKKKGRKPFDLKLTEQFYDIFALTNLSDELNNLFENVVQLQYEIPEFECIKDFPKIPNET